MSSKPYWTSSAFWQCSMSLCLSSAMFFKLPVCLFNAGSHDHSMIHEVSPNSRQKFDITKLCFFSLSSSFFPHAVYLSILNQNLSGQNLSTPMLKIQNEHLEHQFLQPKLSNRFSVRTETQLQPRDSVSVSVSKNSLQRMQNLHWNTDFGCSCATTCARGREVGREEERKKASLERTKTTKGVHGSSLAHYVMGYISSRTNVIGWCISSRTNVTLDADQVMVLRGEKKPKGKIISQFYIILILFSSSPSPPLNFPPSTPFLHVFAHFLQHWRTQLLGFVNLVM